MSSKDERKHPRTRINAAGGTTDHTLHLEVYDQRYILDQVHDVSVSGTGIQIPQEIQAGTPVKLVLRSADVTVGVRGITVWCDNGGFGSPDHAAGSYRVGVQFDPKDRNIPLFFLALKQHVGNIADLF